MKLVKSTLKDVPAIMRIIGDAQKYLAELGIDQWQDGYPNEEQIRTDIEKDESYIITNNKNIVIGTTVFTLRAEPTYNNIEEGEWITSKTSIYGVIHRLAVDNKYRSIGMAKFVFDACEKMIENNSLAQSLRIDTHRKNVGMQKLLKNRNYQYCGIIYVDRGGERLAYEKKLPKINKTEFTCGIDRENNDCGDASEY